MNAVKHLIPDLQADAISTDAIVNLRLLKEEFPKIVTMGNISTYLLEFGPTEKVSTQTKKLVADGINIIAPACGLSTSTALRHIRAMSGAVKAGETLL
jgi:[methyl-Co(III) methanol-specific corrinoid protein]:coenzyme M methyltransferase